MYLLVLIILSCLAIIETFNPEILNRSKFAVVFAVFCMFVFHDGFRWETGCDWDTYHFYFEFFFQETQKENSLTAFEPGYMLFVGAIRSLTDEYSVYLIVHAIVFYAMVFYAVFKTSPHPFTSLMILYAVIVPYMGTNRQLLAVAIYLIGLYLLDRGYKVYYIALIILAAFFHKSVLICLIALFLGKRVNAWVIGIAISFAFVINVSGIMNMLSPLAMLLIKDDVMSEKLTVYNEMLDYNVSPVTTIISLMRKFIWLGILMWYDRIVENKGRLYNICFNMYFIGIVMYVMLNGTVWQTFMARLMMYFSIAEIFIIVYVLNLFKANYGKLAIMVLLSLYCWINISKGFSNYGEKTDYFEPYKGIFINTDYVRHNTD